MNTKPGTRLFVAAVLSMGVLLGGCREKTDAAPQQQAHPVVGVIVVQPQKVSLTTELSGRTSAHLIAEVRPQVGGIIQKRLFTEGSDVKANEVLYQIDPASYRAAHNSAKAALARAEATFGSIRLKEERYRELVKINAISQQEYDDASAALKEARAEVAAAQAAVETASIHLAYTSVKAPISGRIGRSSVTTGALVTASQGAPLAVIQQLDPVYVDVTQTTSELLRLKRALASGLLKSNGDQAEVRLLLEDGSAYPIPGTLKFSDVTVEPTTGSVALRTSFSNPDNLLLPGMFVRAILEEGVNEQAILVPQRGVTRNPAGHALVMVVGAEEKVEQRLITVDRTVGDQWLVSTGLQAGDRVILEGIQKTRPGTVVTTVPFGGQVAAKQ
ncbi:MAG: efflux RND transporter periplasmic adaptor subunit [Desulfuromonadales bacterium]